MRWGTLPQALGEIAPFGAASGAAILAAFAESCSAGGRRSRTGGF